MSCMEEKVVLRIELSHLRGKTRHEVYPTFKELLGETDEIEEFDGKVEYFSYKGVYQPVCDYENNRWGIDLVLHHASEYSTYVEMATNGLSLGEFENYAHEMAEKFGVDMYKVRYIGYSWYNGSDEPIQFD